MAVIYKKIIKNIKIVQAALQEPFQPDDTELRTLKTEFEDTLLRTPTVSQTNTEKSMNTLKNCSLNLAR